MHDATVPVRYGWHHAQAHLAGFGRLGSGPAAETASTTSWSTNLYWGVMYIEQTRYITLQKEFGMVAASALGVLAAQCVRAARAYKHTRGLCACTSGQASKQTLFSPDSHDYYYRLLPHTPQHFNNSQACMCACAAAALVCLLHSTYVVVCTSC